MAQLDIHAGDFGTGKGSLSFPPFGMGKLLTVVKPVELGKFSWTGTGEPVFVELQTVELASEESVKRLGGAVGWGLVGGALLGPVGLLAGVLAGGNKTQVTFVASFKDGKRMLATTDSGTFKKLTALVF